MSPWGEVLVGPRVWAEDTVSWPPPTVYRLPLMWTLGSERTEVTLGTGQVQVHQGTG